MRYYVFRLNLDKANVTITCNNYRKCPLLPGHILLMGVTLLKETHLPRADVETISIPKKDITYYTECYSEEDSEEDSEIDNTESEE